MNNREDGNLLVLGIAIWVFIMMLVLIIGAGVHLHNERKDLLAHADATALALVNEISDSQYYTGQAISYDEQEILTQARARVASTVDKLSHPTGVAGDNVVITLCRTVEVPFVPRILSAFQSVEMCATSSARLRIEVEQ
ncbi:hypothetical protein [Arcanobacterium phocae]|uniref:hypothetical protein n=1 Tax=Arcanobacterium phocae TaxID=131112 RepID=UPI001C0F30B8|nr:hypothetical protein [Arcanobacterium phocae]